MEDACLAYVSEQFRFPAHGVIPKNTTVHGPCEPAASLEILVAGSIARIEY